MPNVNSNFSGGIGAGLSDVADIVGSSIRQRQNNMFELAYLSKKIEQEAMAKQQETEQEHELNTLPKGALSAGLKVLGVPESKANDLENLFPNGAPQGVLQELGGPLGMEARAEAMVNRPQFIHTTDANGVIHVQAMSPLTGPIGQPTVAGLEPSRVHAANQSTAAYGAINGDLQQLQPQLQQLLTKYPNAAGIPLQQLQGWASQHGIPGAFDPTLKAFQDTMPQLGLTFGKMQTGSIRGWEMAKADINALPNLSDSLDSANQKLAIVNQRALNNHQASLMAYDPGNFLKNPMHPIAQGQNIGQMAADANQLHTTAKGVKYTVSQ